MSVLAQFALNNLLPALLAGSLAWAFVHAAVRVLGIRHGRLRLCLYAAPLLKSTLVLLGLLPVLPWPREIFGPWWAQALPVETVLPWFILSTGLLILGQWFARDRARRRLLAGSNSQAPPRLVQSLDRVMDAYRNNVERIVGRCRFDGVPARPNLRAIHRDLRGPAVVFGEEPVIVFPAAMVESLSDPELDASLAHEVAHVYLRQPASCFSAENVRAMSAANPFGALIAAQLHREEEKACDDIAVDVLSNRDDYADMLIRVYRLGRSSAANPSLRYAHQLLGTGPMFSERIEHLLARDDTSASSWERVAFGAVWIVLLAVFFAG